MDYREASESVPVVVAGGGPVGMMLADELRVAGIAVVVLERLPEPDRVLKAGSIGPLAVEALDRLGLRDAMVAAEQVTMAGYAQMAATAGAGEGAARLAAAQKEHFAGLEKLDAQRRSDPSRRRMRVPQPVLVDMLRERGRQLGVDIRLGHEVTGLHQDEQGVTVEVATPSGPTRLRARYLVGCDGSRSVVRTAAGFPFPGTEATMIGRQGVVELADPKQIPPGIEAMPGGVLVYGLGVDRVAALEFSPLHVDPGEFTLDELHDAVLRVSGIDLKITRLRAGGRFTDEARQVPAYRLGRVLLAGDAARIHAPVGGQGLNVGLIDAVNLGWKLAACLRGWHPEEFLDTYTAERHPVAAGLLQNTRAQIALMRPDPHSRALRELFGELLDLDDVNRHIGDMMAGLDTRYDLGDADPLVGTLCPDMKLTPRNGEGGDRVTRLAELPRDGSGLLLRLDGCPPLEETAGAWAGRVRVVAAAADRDDVRAMALRPDGCVAWVQRPGEPVDRDGLGRALRAWFGEPDHFVQN